MSNPCDTVNSFVVISELNNVETNLLVQFSIL